MTKKTESDILQTDEENIVDIPASDVLKQNFMPYSMSVIVSRAIPELVDGLKPSHRKLLYTMYEMGLLTGNRTKSANIAARTMLLNPHGDAGNYETMVRLTQNNEALLTPLVDGKGNFGKHFSRDMAFAASRYTEAKLAPPANEFFRSIRKDTVDFIDNYDGTRKEPVVLPVTFPNILANPTEGIAVGMASSIPSFNLSELCDATIQRIKEPDKSVLDIMPAPDFPTGAQILYDREEMQKAYDTGRGSFRMRGCCQVDKKERVLEITQIPYTTTAEAIIEGVISAVKNGKLKAEVNDVRNEIDLNGFKLAIDYKKGTDPDILIQKLYKLTKLEDTYSFNMTVLVDGRSKVLGVHQVLDEWIARRRECVKRELSFDLEKKKNELHLLEGLEKVLLDIDKAIRIIRQAEEDSRVVPDLMLGFGLDKEQAEYIAEIKLRNLNKRWILEKTKNIEKLGKEIRTLERQIGSDREIGKLMIRSLTEVKKKYGAERKSVLVPAEEAKTADNVDTIPDYPVTFYRTREGYIKKVAASSLRGGAEVKTKEDDEIIQELTGQNLSEILFFTNKCNVYKLHGYDLKDSKPSELGEYASNVMAFEAEEYVLAMCLLEEGKTVVIGFENGKIAKFPLSVYETKQNRKKLLKAFSDISPVAGLCIIEKDEKVAVMSSKGRLLIVNTEDISEKSSRTTQGIQAMKLPARGGKVIRFCPAEGLGLESESGYGYRRLPAQGGVYDGQESLEL